MVGIADEDDGRDHRDQSRATVQVGADDADAVVLTMSGELDLASVATLQADIDRLTSDANSRVVFDMSDVHFMDTSGLALLLTVANRVSSVEVRAPSSPVRRVIELAGLAPTFRIAP